MCFKLVLHLPFPDMSVVAGAVMNPLPAEPSALHVPHMTGHSPGTLLKSTSKNTMLHTSLHEDSEIITIW